jgi:hypothetical protein
VGASIAPIVTVEALNSLGPYIVLGRGRRQRAPLADAGRLVEFSSAAAILPGTPRGPRAPSCCGSVGL